MTQAFDTAFNAALDRLHTHRVILGGEERLCNADTFKEVCDELVKKHGGIPRCEPIETEPVPAAVSAQTGVRLVQQGLGSNVNLDAIRMGDMDTVGRDRSAADQAAAIAAGFSPASPIFARGSRATGMREHRNEFEALPKTGLAMRQLEETVVAEERADTTRQVQGIRMNSKGFLLVDVNRDDVPPTHFSVSRRALPALASRIGMPPGAGSYLRDIRPEVRAININRWCAEDVPALDAASLVDRVRQGEGPAPSAIVLRTRKSGGNREVFGVVSEGYGAIDADKIARSVAKVTGDDTRCHVKYDGFRTQVDVLWFSNVVPEHAVAGEYFKAGVRVRTDDTGGGSVRVSAMIWQNLCLNFVIIDEAAQETARITHVGDPDKLAARFEAAFKQAQDRLVHFRKAWGYAVEDVVDAHECQRIEDVVTGYYNAIIERELVPLPKRGRDQVVGDLLSMWSKDDSGARFNPDGSPRLVTRAAIVNGITRYAHEVNQDPFAQHELEAAAGRLLFGKKGAPPAALPFLPME